MNQRRALVAGVAVVVCAVVSGHLKLIGANPKFVVIVKDLTKSTRADQDSLNNLCIESLLGGLDAGDEVCILAITEASLADPLMILHEQLPNDPHPLQARLMAARENLIESWRKQLAIATPRRKQSDIVGAICYASLLNRSKHLEKWLVLLSDMRNATPLLDLENVAEIDDEESLNRIRQVGLMPDLSGFHVVVLGAHTLGISSLAYYESLKAFWQAFFDAAHAELITFQPDRSWAPFGQENGKVKIPQTAK